MRLRLLFCLAAIPGVALPADLQKEDLRSVQEAFRKADPKLDWFETSAKKPFDAARSVMIVRAAPTEVRPVGPQNVLKRVPVSEKMEIGVFVVSGTSNGVRLVLDLLPESEVYGFPRIDQPGANSVDLHFYSDYGVYEGSIKYIYDLGSGKAPVKIRFGILGLTASKIRNGSITYAASSSGPSERHATIAIYPRAGDALPLYKITDIPAPPDALPEPVSMRLPNGRTVIVTNTLPGQVHQLAGLAITDKSGASEFYSAPVPTMALDRKMRPNEQAPGEIENDIGPVAVDGSTVWFANRFYDGEGTSGVGAVGAFDLRTHKFDMRYLPQIVAWSGSAMRLDGGDLWIGLMRQPEGAAFGGGLLRYNLRTGSVAKFEIPDYIYMIDRVGDAVYCGTSNGLYIVRSGKIRHLVFEPDSGGELMMR